MIAKPIDTKTETGRAEIATRVRGALSISLACSTLEASLMHARSALDVRRGTKAAQIVEEAVRAVFDAAGKSSDGHTWRYAGDDQSHGGRCYSHRQRCAMCGASRRAYHDPDNATSGQPTRWYAKH